MVIFNHTCDAGEYPCRKVTAGYRYELSKESVAGAFPPAAETAAPAQRARAPGGLPAALLEYADQLLEEALLLLGRLLLLLFRRQRRPLGEWDRRRRAGGLARGAAGRG